MAATIFHPISSAPGAEEIDVEERAVYSDFRVMDSYVKSCISFQLSFFHARFLLISGWVICLMVEGSSCSEP